MLKLAIATASLFASASVLAQAPAPPQQTASADQKVNPLDKMICRYEDTVGTRLGKHKVCATLREWKDQEDENRQELDRVQQTTGVPSDPSGG
jgi:hypothetical protein